MAAAMLLLSGCGPTAPREDAAGRALEQAAISTGTIRDPAASAVAGLYARDTDRLCVVGGKDEVYRIGVSVDYGEGGGCSGRGTASRSGETLRIVFDGTAGCQFDASIDQDRIVFPGELPDACARLCTARASLAALDVELLSDASAEAAAMHDARGRQLCGS